MFISLVTGSLICLAECGYSIAVPSIISGLLSFLHSVNCSELQWNKEIIIIHTRHSPFMLYIPLPFAGCRIALQDVCDGKKDLK